jgi:hypothetical protein
MEQTLRVGHLMVLLHFGNMSKETTLYNTQRFANEVMPRLRPMWSEYADNWWPRTPGITAPAVPVAAD